MTKRLPATAAPLPLEEYAAQFDNLFTQRSQREGFRRYLEGLLLPAERNKTATGLANTEPVVGAQHPRAQALQGFLSESTWDPATVNARRLALLRSDSATAPDGQGVLVIDEHGDRKWGHKTAHVGRQYLANLGKTDSGVVSVTSLWADETVYWPVAYAPYTPKHHFARGKADPAFRTKLQIAGELVAAAVADDLPFRAVVADSFYGEDAGFRQRLHELAVGYVLALKPSHTWWHQIGTVGALWAAAEAAGWRGADAPGAWVAVDRRFRDGHAETWWALEVEAGPYGPTRGLRAVVATTDPVTLPRPCDLVPCHQPADLRRRPRRDCAPVRAQDVGGAGLQTDQTRAGVVAVPGPQRRGDAPSLAVGLLRLRLLLVAPPARCRWRRAPGGGQHDRPTGRWRGDGAGGKYARRARRGAGRWRYAPCGRGSRRGSCSGAAGGPGRRCPRHPPCAPYSSPCATARGLISTPRPDPSPQSTGNKRSEGRFSPSGKEKRQQIGSMPFSPFLTPNLAYCDACLLPTAFWLCPVHGGGCCALHG